MALIDTALGQTDVVYVDTTETHTQADLISLGVLSADTTVYTGNGTMDLTSVLGVDALSNRYTVATGGADLTINAGLLDLNVASARTLLVDGDSTITFSAGSVSARSALTNVLNNTTIAFSGSGDGTFTYNPPTINLVSAVTLTIDEMGAGDKVVIPMAGGGLYALRESGYNASTGYLTLTNGVGILSQSVTVRIKMTQAEYDTYAANTSLYLNGATDTFTFPGDDSSQPVYDVPCFSAGTLIRTAQGEVAIETLKVGDMVETRDNGLQPIRWVGSVHLGPQDLQRAPNLRPIRIRAGALGRGCRKPICWSRPSTGCCCARRSPSGCSAPAKCWSRPSSFCRSKGSTSPPMSPRSPICTCCSTAMRWWFRTAPRPRRSIPGRRRFWVWERKRARRSSRCFPSCAPIPESGRRARDRCPRGGWRGAW